MKSTDLLLTVFFDLCCGRRVGCAYQQVGPVMPAPVRGVSDDAFRSLPDL
jgi:hypothetical protein